MSLQPFQVLGTISVTAGAKKSLATEFATILDQSKWSCSVNTVYFEANEANGGILFVGDSHSTDADPDSWSAALAAGDWRAFASGMMNNMNPREFYVAAKAGTQKVRVSITKT